MENNIRKTGGEADAAAFIPNISCEITVPQGRNPDGAFSFCAGDRSCAYHVCLGTHGARRMLADGDQIINRYYAGRNRLELEDSADSDSGAYKTKADLIFRLEEGGNHKVIGFAHRNGTMNVGEYPVSLYSGQDPDDAEEKMQKTESDYRYSRQ